MSHPRASVRVVLALSVILMSGSALQLTRASHAQISSAGLWYFAPPTTNAPSPWYSPLSSSSSWSAPAYDAPTWTSSSASSVESDMPTWTLPDTEYPYEDGLHDEEEYDVDDPAKAIPVHGEEPSRPPLMAPPSEPPVQAPHPAAEEWDLPAPVSGIRPEDEPGRLKLGESAPSDFSDVPETHPQHSAIQTSVELGIFEGNPDGTFAPDEQINRAELASAMTKDASEEERAMCRDFPSFYVDVPEDAWFKEAACLARLKGLMQGQGDGGRFDPAGAVNFAQAAKVIVKKFDLSVSEVQVGEWYEPYFDALEDVGVSMPTIQIAATMPTRGDVAGLVQKVAIGLAKVGEEPDDPVTTPEHTAAPSSSSAPKFTILWSADVLGSGVVRNDSCAAARQDALRDALTTATAVSEWGSNVPALAKRCLQGTQYTAKGKSWGLDPYPTLSNGTFSWSGDSCARDGGTMSDNCCILPSRSFLGDTLTATVGIWKNAFHCYAEVGEYQ